MLLKLFLVLFYLSWVNNGLHLLCLCVHKWIQILVCHQSHLHRKSLLGKYQTAIIALKIRVKSSIFLLEEGFRILRLITRRIWYWLVHDVSCLLRDKLFLALIEKESIPLSHLLVPVIILLIIGCLVITEWTLSIWDDLLSCWILVSGVCHQFYFLPELDKSICHSHCKQAKREI